MPAKHRPKHAAPRRFTILGSRQPPERAERDDDLFPPLRHSERLPDSRPPKLRDDREGEILGDGRERPNARPKDEPKAELKLDKPRIQDFAAPGVASRNGDKREFAVSDLDEGLGDDFWNEGARRRKDDPRRREAPRKASRPERQVPAAWMEEKPRPRLLEREGDTRSSTPVIKANSRPSERLRSGGTEPALRPHEEPERRPYAIPGGIGRRREEPQDSSPLPPAKQPRSPKKPPGGPPPEQTQTLGQWFKEITILGIVAVGTAVLLTTYVIQAFFIPSESMEDTLQRNDRVLVNKISYKFWEPESGDIVVFESPEGEPAPPPANTPFARFMDKVVIAIGLKSSEQDLIKRVVATEGQTIEAKLGLVFVDGQQVDEPYVKPSDQPIQDFAPVTVPVGHVFVMGDNRLDSRDSRAFGSIPRTEIIGKAFARVWPWERVAWLER